MQRSAQPFTIAVSDVDRCQQKFGDKHGVPFSYPKHNRCNNMKHFVLRGEWSVAPACCLLSARVVAELPAAGTMPH